MLLVELHTPLILFQLCAYQELTSSFPRMGRNQPYIKTVEQNTQVFTNDLRRTLIFPDTGVAVSKSELFTAT